LDKNGHTLSGPKVFCGSHHQGNLLSCNVFLKLWRLAAFGDFREKNTNMHVALRGNFSAPVRVIDLVEVSKGAASLLVCTRKNILWLRGVDFL